MFKRHNDALSNGCELLGWAKQHILGIPASRVKRRNIVSLESPGLQCKPPSQHNIKKPKPVSDSSLSSPGPDCLHPSPTEQSAPGSSTLRHSHPHGPPEVPEQAPFTEATHHLWGINKPLGVRREVDMYKRTLLRAESQAYTSADSRVGH